MVPSVECVARPTTALLGEPLKVVDGGRMMQATRYLLTLLALVLLYS